MDKEWWAALVDACVLAVSLLAAEFIDAALADLVVKIVVAFQPVVLSLLIKMYAERQAAEIRGDLERTMRELRR